MSRLAHLSRVCEAFQRLRQIHFGVRNLRLESGKDIMVFR